MSLDRHRLIDTLKRIGYPDTENLGAAECDWICEDKELKPFFQAFCDSVTVDNVLTFEEVEEYEKFQAVVSANPTLMKKIELSDDYLNPDEEKEVMDDLQSSIASMSSYVQHFDHQANILIQHKMKLIQEQTETERTHKNLQQDIRQLQNELLPAAVEQLRNCIDKEICIVDEVIDVCCMEADKEQNKPFFKEDLKPYLESEQEVLDTILKFLTKDFQKFVESSGTSNIHPQIVGLLPELSVQQLQEQNANKLSKLQTILQRFEEDYIKSHLETIRKNATVKFHQESVLDNSVMSSLSREQLLVLLQKAKTTLREQKDVESELLRAMPKVLENKIQAQCDHVVFLLNCEKLERLKTYLELLQIPVNFLSDQNARLQMLQIAMNIQEFDLKNLQKAISSIRTNIEEEVKTCTPQWIDEIKANLVDDDDDMKAGSILHALKKILSEVSGEELVFLSKENIAKKYKDHMMEIANTESSVDSLHVELQELIKILETGSSTMEEHLFDVHSKEEDHPQHMLNQLNSNFNKSSWLIQQFEMDLLKKMTDYQKKKEVIFQNRSLYKTRHLYVYALTNRAKFVKLVEEIVADISHMESLSSSI